MGNLIVALNTTDGLDLASSSERCLLSVIGIANKAVLIKEWNIWFDGQLSSAQPVKVILSRMTTLGNMTTASAFGQVIRSGSTSLVSQAIGRQVDMSNTSSEPGSSGILATRFVHPQVGYHEKFPFGEEIVVNGAIAVGIMVNSPSTCSCRGGLVWDE